MLKYQLTLQAKDMKRLKLADKQGYVYYLSIREMNNTSYYTQGVDIVRTEGRFYFSISSSHVSVEIWRYERCRKVATLALDVFKLKQSYQNVFSKANLKLVIKVLSEVSSNGQEESKQYKNEKTLSILSTSHRSDQGICGLG